MCSYTFSFLKPPHKQQQQKIKKPPNTPRPLQLHFLRNYQPGRTPYPDGFPLPPMMRLLFRRWSRPEFLRSGNPLRVPQPTIKVTTDTSHIGWGGGGGGSLPGRLCLWGLVPLQGTPPYQCARVSGCHSVTLLHHFLPLVRHRTVLIRTDNVTVVAYINKQGGTHSTRLNTLAAELWTWCRRRDIIPTASYSPARTI